MCARAFALWLAAAALGAAGSENNSEKLAKSLRRQLIQNNYDYMSAESPETSRPRTRYRKQFHSHDIPHKDDPSSDIHHENIYDEKYRQTINFKSSKNHLIKHNANTEDLEDKSSMKNSDTESIDEDLKGIVQGKKVKVNSVIPDRIHEVEDGEENIYQSKNKNQISYEDNYFTGPQHLNNNHNIRTTTAKYTILKIKKSYRRSGSPSTFIQEETPDSVSIVKVNGGPFPEFRLPRARRQYMQLPGNVRAIDEDDDLPPPLVNETNSDVEDTHLNENEEHIDILQADDSANKAQNMSLVITVTPDEIFVL